MDQFREPSGNGPGAVFARCLDPKWQGLGPQKRTKMDLKMAPLTTPKINEKYVQKKYQK